MSWTDTVMDPLKTENLVNVVAWAGGAIYAFGLVIDVIMNGSPL